MEEFGRIDILAYPDSGYCKSPNWNFEEIIAPALERALLLNEPVVVDVVTDIDSRAPAPWAP